MKRSTSVRIVILAGSLLLQLGALCFHSQGAAGDVDLSFDPGSDVTNPVSVVVVQPDGKVLIGGPLTFINGTNHYASGRLNADGSLDSTFVSDSFNPDWTLLFQNGFFNFAEAAVVAVQSDGKVLVGGVVARICSVGEEECQHTFSSFVTRLNPNGSHDTNFTSFIGDYGLAAEQIPQVKTVAVQRDGKVVVGYVGYGLVRGIIRLNTNGIRDTNFNASIGSGLGVDSVVPQADGKLLLGGSFNTVNGTNRNGLARLNPDGSLDGTFNPVVGGSPLALQPDGKVLVRGYVRLNADGSLDLSFSPGTGTEGPVCSIALQPDGNVLIGGDFTTINGVVRPYVARLYGDSAAPSLNIMRSNAFVIVSWPVTGITFQLQETTNIALPNSWSIVAQPVVANAGQISVTVPTTVGPKLFRLKLQ
jgi:uncharacterized delta-60 repeat protein